MPPVQEFFQQGDREKAAKLPVSALMDRAQKGGITRSQVTAGLVCNCCLCSSKLPCYMCQPHPEQKSPFPLPASPCPTPGSFQCTAWSQVQALQLSGCLCA